MGVVGPQRQHVNYSVLFLLVGFNTLFGGFALNIGIDNLMYTHCVCLQDWAGERGASDTLLNKVVVSLRYRINIFTNDIRQWHSERIMDGRQVVNN